MFKWRFRSEVREFGLKGICFFNVFTLLFPFSRLMDPAFPLILPSTLSAWLEINRNARLREIRVDP